MQATIAFMPPLIAHEIVSDSLPILAGGIEMT
jgi:hypothetical protein